MKTERILINGKPAMGILYDDKDYESMKKIYADWKGLNDILESFNSRALNVPDLLSEGLFCSVFNVYRTNGEINSSSYDAYDTKNNLGIQIKSCSIENDCTSFGPKTHWNKIYFMKFYPKSVDGKIEIFDISDYDLDKIVMNAKKGETFKDQQEQGRRPRFSVMKEIITKYNVKPIKTLHLLEE